MGGCTFFQSEDLVDGPCTFALAIDVVDPAKNALQTMDRLSHGCVYRMVLIDVEILQTFILEGVEVDVQRKQIEVEIPYLHMLH